MNKEQAHEEFTKIIQEVNKEHEEIIKKAIENGTWQMGLDSNRELFIESDNRAKEKIKELEKMIDEE